MFVRNHREGVKWLPGWIEERSGPVSFRVKLTDGKVVRCHQDQVRKRATEADTQTIPSDGEDDSWAMATPEAPQPSENTFEENPTAPEQSASNSTESETVSEPKTYSSRNRQPPIRYSDTCQ